MMATISILIGISGLFVGFIAGVLAASIGDDDPPTYWGPEQ